jgi:hypothetical protein
VTCCEAERRVRKAHRVLAHCNRPNIIAVGAVGGTFWGALIGLIFLMPLAGAAIGAASGVIGGALSDVAQPLTLASTSTWSPCLSWPVTLVSTSEGPL